MPRLLRLHFETVSVMLLRSPDGSRRTSARIPQSRQATGERKSAKAYRYIAVERGERERQSGLKKGSMDSARERRWPFPQWRLWSGPDSLPI
jgi:hypothetical protein